MKKQILLILFVPALLVLGSISGCYYDDVIPDVRVYSGDEVTFSGDLLPIFNASCNISGCHSSGGEKPELTASNAYESLISGGYIDISSPESSELYQWVKGNRNTTMPLNGTDPQIVSSVLLWIQQGANNN